MIRLGSLGWAVLIARHVGRYLTALLGNATLEIRGEGFIS